MDVAEIMQKFKQLPPPEQEKVADLVMELTGRDRPLSGAKLETLAAQLAAEGSDEADSARLKEEIHRGFYGKGRPK